MRENYPRIQSGEAISASQHLNPLFDFANAWARRYRSSAGVETSGFSGGANLPPFYENYLEIEDRRIDPARAEGEGLYTAYQRYFSKSTSGGPGQWLTHESLTDPSLYKYDVDAREVPGGLSFIKDDKVSAWWHEQRQAFVPTNAVAPLVGRAVTDIDNGSSGFFRLIKMTPSGWSDYLPLTDVEAYNFSGIGFKAGKVYEINSLAQSEVLHGFPYQAAVCTDLLPPPGFDCCGWVVGATDPETGKSTPPSGYLYGLIQGGAWDNWPVVLFGSPSTGYSGHPGSDVLQTGVGCGVLNLGGQEILWSPYFTAGCGVGTNANRWQLTSYLYPLPAESPPDTTQPVHEDQVISCFCDDLITNPYGPFVSDPVGTCSSQTWHMKSLSCQPICPYTLGGTIPSGWDVSVTGTTNGFPVGCENNSCDNINGVYNVSLPFPGSTWDPGGVGCGWQYDNDGSHLFTCERTPVNQQWVFDISVVLSVNRNATTNQPEYQMTAILSINLGNPSSDRFHYQITQNSPFDLSLGSFVLPKVLEIKNLGACVGGPSLTLIPL